MKVKVYVVDFELSTHVKKWALRVGIPIATLLVGGVALAGLPGGYADGSPLTAEALTANFNYVQNEIAAIPPINDQSAASSFIRIGAMQICWGNATTASNGYASIAFPAQFLDTSYSLSATSSYAGVQAGWAMAGALTTSGASVQYLQWTGSAATPTSGPVAWTAVGRWE
jgi:hypothetical protein